MAGNQENCTTSAEEAAATANSPATMTLENEITNIKQQYGSKCKIIKNIGAYQYIVKVLLDDYGVTVKFQISEDYPRSRPVVILTWRYLSDTSLDDGLRSLIMSQTTLSAMLHTATDWLHSHTDLLSKEEKEPRKKKKEKRRKNRQTEDEIEKKKPSMKTAIDVISRIQWDSSLEADLFTVGYVDRFLGVVEKSFSILSWEDPASVDDHEVLAIPKHRIEYFKYKDFKVWDKKTRTDYVFGSSGDKRLTINDIIDQYDQLVESEPKAKPEAEPQESGSTSNDTDSDDDDDGIQITLNTNMNVAAEKTGETKRESESDDEDPYWGNKLRPNYFVCVHIQDPEIRSMVEHVQDILITREPLYESCCMQISALHVTLCALRLNGLEQIQDAVRALTEFKDDFSRFKTTLRLEGTDLFNNRVLYARIHKDENLVKMVDCMKLALRSNGIELIDGFDFVPHMTIMKTSRPVSRQIGRQIPKSVYSGAENVRFGEQEVDNINLCEMGDAKANDGFYLSALKLKI